MPVQVPDLRRSASHRHMISHLTGPFQAGAVDTPIPVGEDGVVEVSWVTREPLLLVGTRVPLDNKTLQLEVKLPDGNHKSFTFAPYTEAEAYLPLYRPPANAQTHTVEAIELVTLVEVAADGTRTPFPAADINDHIEIRLLEGLMGRMIYLLGAEKQRLRRQAREITAARLLPFARDNALDRIGADLGVPRFTGTIDFQPADEVDLPAIFGGFNFGDRRFGRGSRGETVTATRREPDDEYRRRLAIYRRLTMPNRRQVERSLNGPGEASEPNRGLLAGLGFPHRFRIVESDNQFAVAVHLIATGSEDYRANFLEYIRAVHLVWPARNSTADRVHANRYLSVDEKARISGLRKNLQRFFEFDANAAIAPMLASALDRVGRCRHALDITTPWTVLRSQDSDGGSRYELGLGVDVSLPTATELDTMASRLRNPDRQSVRDAEIEGLLRSITPLPADQDREGQWLLGPCGMRTIHRLSSDRLYLSNLPVLGMVIDGPSRVDAYEPASLQVSYYASGDIEGNVVLISGLRRAAARWTASGAEAWKVLSREEAREYWDNATASIPRPLATALRAAGFRMITGPELDLASLAQFSERSGAALLLPQTQARRLLSGRHIRTAIDALVRIRRLLYEEGIVSVSLLVTEADDVLLLVSTSAAPAAGSGVSENRSTVFRWYAMPIGANQPVSGTIEAAGSCTVFTPSREGLSAILAIGYARRGLSDPYEFRVELPDDARLEFLQYEFLMNLLQQFHPLGVCVNTFSIRQEHVDLDGDGDAEPLWPMIARTYRQFLWRRRSAEPRHAEDDFV